MTDAASPELYPQYCFHLSPTISRWCHLRIADIYALSSHAGFRGQDLFFRINHPIKWVRIAGVVVAIDEFEGRRLYTVDDSSGATIGCVVITTPTPGITNYQATHTRNAISTTGSKSRATDPPPPQPLPVIDGEIDVGHVIDIKGSIKLFREQKQIQAEKISHLRSTDQEVRFWEKIVGLRKEVLDRPWVLDRREVRKCRKAAEGHVDRRADKLHKRRGSTAEVADFGTRTRTVKPPESVPLQAKARKTGLEAESRTNATSARSDESEASRANMRRARLDADFGTRVRSCRPSENDILPTSRRKTGLEADSGTQAKAATSAEGVSRRTRTRVTGLEPGSDTHTKRPAAVDVPKTRVKKSGLEADFGTHKSAGLAEREVPRASRRRSGLKVDFGTSASSASSAARNPQESRVRISGLERKPKSVMKPAPVVTGKYEALGL
ncbi:OB-fold nucleic acid binding domain-containing protein [Podospora appendiculata]|uniref:OB-fold nucleic acid binding domain-containing protein n=1 Tax=Podospora appendiculata TaxID=314037 RepID=A0AAE1CFK3_9PEZI|nr:OB-fold nucleic acid binding domain-containing protein [Podospora appendiculata]